MEPHIKKLLTEAQSVDTKSAKYWELRCKYLEKSLDPTYLPDERNNAWQLHQVLAKREP